MGIFQDVYNWLAMRNIGKMLGLMWNPDTDLRYQRNRLRAKANDWLEMLTKADLLLGKGEAKKAGNLAYGALEHLPHPILPEIVQVHELAKRIIVGLPQEYVPPKPTPRSTIPRLAADQAMFRLSEATKLAIQDRYKEAHSIICDVLEHDLFTYGRIDKADARMLALRLNNVVWEKLKCNQPLK